MYHVNQNSWHGRIFVRNSAKLGLSEGDLQHLKLPGYLTTITVGSLLLFVRDVKRVMRIMTETFIANWKEQSSREIFTSLAIPVLLFVAMCWLRAEYGSAIEALPLWVKILGSVALSAMSVGAMILIQITESRRRPSDF